jgi:hypothetical protein
MSGPFVASFEHPSRKEGEAGSGRAQMAMCSRHARTVLMLSSDLKLYLTPNRPHPHVRSDIRYLTKRA